MSPDDMSPDEWNEGVRNEAEHAPDPAWSGEARRHARWTRRWRSGREILVMIASTLLFSAGVTLVSLSPVLNREAARNQMDLSTFLWWGMAGNPVPVHTVSMGDDPHLPVMLLLMMAGVGAVFAARRGMNAFTVLVAAACGWLTVLVLTSWVPSVVVAATPLTKLLIVLSAASLGLLLGRLSTRASRRPVA